MPDSKWCNCHFCWSNHGLFGHDTKRRDRTSHRRGLPAHGYSSPSPSTCPNNHILDLERKKKKKTYVDELLLLQGLIFLYVQHNLSHAAFCFYHLKVLFLFLLRIPNFSYVFPTFPTSQTFESIYVKVYSSTAFIIAIASLLNKLTRRHERVVCRSRKVKKKKCGRKYRPLSPYPDSPVSSR